MTCDGIPCEPVVFEWWFAGMYVVGAAALLLLIKNHRRWF